MKVPLLDLKPQNTALLPQLREAFERVMASGMFILGPEVQNLENLCNQAAATRQAIGVSSGTDALLLALMTLDIGAGDEVICPSFTFFATVGCIARTGALPVFADSCPICFNIDVAHARKLITPHTKAIMPVHLFGQMAAMDAVMALAKEYNIRVIEDAAQSLGASYRGRPAGSIGDFGTFSFFPSKNLGGFGDSGMLVSNDDALGDKARLLRAHGAKPKYFHEMVGGNFRIDPLQAAMISVKMAHLEDYTSRRASNAAHYTEKLSALAGVAAPSDADCACASGQAEPDWAAKGARVVLPTICSENKHVWNQYTLRILSVPGAPNARDAFKDFLGARQIGTEIYYPRPMHLQECFPPPGGVRPTLPVCERLAGECISIPIYPELQREQQDAVITAIVEFLNS
jgi:dTDP-4-amino-4,6-dideoxygalactose transaminase